MKRSVHVAVFSAIALAAWAGVVSAQAPAVPQAPPAIGQGGARGAGGPPAAVPGPGRGFVPVLIRTFGARAAGGRDSASDAGGTGAGQRRRSRSSSTRDKSVRQAAAEEVRIAADAAAAAAERRRPRTRRPTQRHGAAARRLRRDREEGQHRSAAARRLDHRLVGAGRREQGDVRQVFRRASRPRTSPSPATRRRACCGA